MDLPGRQQQKYENDAYIRHHRSILLLVTAIASTTASISIRWHDE